MMAQRVETTAESWPREDEEEYGARLRHIRVMCTFCFFGSPSGVLSHSSGSVCSNAPTEGHVLVAGCVGGVLGAYWKL